MLGVGGVWWLGGLIWPKDGLRRFLHGGRDARAPRFKLRCLAGLIWPKDGLRRFLHGGRDARAPRKPLLGWAYLVKGWPSALFTRRARRPRPQEAAAGVGLFGQRMAFGTFYTASETLVPPGLSFAAWLGLFGQRMAFGTFYAASETLALPGSRCWGGLIWPKDGLRHFLCGERDARAPRKPLLGWAYLAKGWPSALFMLRARRSRPQV